MHVLSAPELEQRTLHSSAQSLKDGAMDDQDSKYSEATDYICAKIDERCLL